MHSHLYKHTRSIMFSSFEVVRPLVATPSPTVAASLALSSSSCTKGSNEHDDDDDIKINDKTPKVRNPKQVQKKTTAETDTETTADTTNEKTTTLNVQDYVQNFTELASNCIDTAYSMERSIHQSTRTGRLSTCLPEDVFSLLDIQYHSFLDYLLENGFATTTSNNNNKSLTVEGQGLLMSILIFLFRQLQETQERFRPLILNSSCRRSNSNQNNNNVGIEECCAAANDFLKMSEKMEVFMERLQQQHNFLTVQANNNNNNNNTNNPFQDDYRDDINETHPLTNTSTSLSSSTTTSLVQQAASDLILRWSQDAVIAVERVQVVWMRHVHTQTYIATDLFSPCWEADWTHNDVILDLLQNLHGNVLGPMEDYYLGGVTDPGDNDDKDDDDSSNPNQVLYQKALVACCRALVCFYIQCLVQKADAIRRGRRRNVGPAAVLRRRTYQLTTTTTTMDSSSKNTESLPYEQPFKYASRAVLRMTGDIQLIQEFFLEKTADSATLSRIVGDEMRILELIQECLTTTILPHRLQMEETTAAAATGITTTDGSSTGTNSSYNNNFQADADSLESFIVVIHKRIGADPLVTNMFMNDLWLLVAASGNITCSSFKNKEMDQTISTVEQDLHMVSRGMQELGNSMHAGTGAAATNTVTTASSGGGGGDVSFVRLDEMLKAIYEDRLVQGVLPLSVCWNCLPKTTKCSTTNANDEIVSQKIRTWTRNLTELRRWKFTKNNHAKPKPKQQQQQQQQQAQQAPECPNKDLTATTTTTKTAAAETTSASTASALKKTMTTTTKTTTATTATTKTMTTTKTKTTTATTAVTKTTKKSSTVEMMKTKTLTKKTSLSYSSTAAEI